MSLSEERLDEIRAVLNGDQSVGMDEALIVMSKAADDLLDEVDRLRDGVEAMCHRWRGSTNPALHMERQLRALLDPSEGDDHE